jgi:hypothetical protein
MNKIILILFSVLSYGITIAQENDSTLLRINKIAEVKKKQFIHAFPNNKDTCLLDHKKLDTQYRLTYQKVDMQCNGWPGYDETFLTYNNKGLILVSNSVDGIENNNTSFRYTKDEEKPIKTVLFLRETMDSIVTNTRYFRNKEGRLDSFLAVVKNQDGSIMRTTNIARYDENGNLSQLYIIDQKRKPLQMMSYEFDKDSKMKTAGFTSYGEKPTFSQIYFSYNQYGQIANTINTVNQKQEYFYHENGLISNVLSYNPKGVLEIEFIFEYTLRE